MFDKFGEFDSVEELNRAAAAQLAEGDTEAIVAIALENGLDKEDAEDYIDGIVDMLATPTMAAAGKLKLEAEDLELKGIVSDWKDQIFEECLASDLMCAAVRRKGKSLKECLAQILRYAFENKVRVSNKIVDITKVTHNGNEVPMQKPLFLGIPSKAEARKLIKQYYLG